jgi:hypothetical protein
MELTDPRMIAELLAQTKRRDWPRLARGKRLERTYQPTSSYGRRCRCGTCSTCVETERWEKIFQQKFADPDYYSRGRALPHESPLHRL